MEKQIDSIEVTSFGQIFPKKGNGSPDKMNKNEI